MDRRFNRTDHKIDRVLAGLGLNFEGYNKRVLEHFLVYQGLPADKMQWRAIIPDPEGVISPDNFEVEVDLFQQEPLIVVEITALEDSLEKVRRFIDIVRWLERKFNQKATAYFLTYDFDELIAEEAQRILKEASVKVICTKT